jgi:hypothetical protein
VYGKLNPETLTMTTSYPSPAGIYNQLVATGQTILARDTASNGGKVGIGSPTPPASLLDVFGTAHLRGAPGTKGLYVNPAGDVGIGTLSPTQSLDVNGNIYELGASVPRGVTIVSKTASRGGAGQCTVFANCGSQLTVATQCVLWSGVANLQNSFLGWCTFNCTTACSCESFATCLTP